MANETAGARHRGVQGRGIQMKSSAAFAKGIGGSITLCIEGLSRIEPHIKAS